MNIHSWLIFTRRFLCYILWSNKHGILSSPSVHRLSCKTEQCHDVMQISQYSIIVISYNLYFWNVWHGNSPRTAHKFDPDAPEIEPILPEGIGIWSDVPIEIRENDGCFSAGIASNSTKGHDERCCCWNFGWYGSSIRIFPHRLKNKAIAATHSTNTATTMSTSSVRTITFGPTTKRNNFHLVRLTMKIQLNASEL